uniref:VAN3-binding protein-like auxin canalisation domain-containing protein n=1 Tax=Oryza brachyantha TaxID=4533 RepID=J3N518_ORYBR
MHSVEGMSSPYCAQYPCKCDNISAFKASQAESPQIDVRKAAILCKEKSRRSKCCHPADMPIIPEQAMEFLSRTWSPSSSDLFQTLRTSSENLQPEKASKDEEENEEKDEGQDEGTHLSTVHVSGGKNQSFNQTWCVLASEMPSPIQRKHKLKQPTWQLNVKYMKEILRGHFLNGVAVTGRQQKKRKEELRLQAAKAHASVSVAQLAAAIASIVSVCELRPANLKCVEAADCKKMGTVLASAAALIATVCAEAAEISGADRSRVRSAVKTGLESCSSTELLTLTATAATCLRGAAALKLRADARGISRNSSVGINATSFRKGTILRVRLPCGSVRVRTVAFFPQHGTVALRLGKRHLHGVFSTYKDYEVQAVSIDGGEGGGGGGPVLFPLALSTAAGVVQLLLDSQVHCKVWKSAIEDMLLSDQNTKHAKR